MQGYKPILIYGFAIFAMFFGSGNLVFPLQIGQASGSYWFFGFLGLLLTGIFLPFLGFFVIKLHKGSYDSFFMEAGPFARILLPLFTLSLLGSFGVVPRCITVAHGGISYLAPTLPLLGFSFIFCTITFFFCLKDHLMIKLLGKWMSPILLASLLLLIGLGVAQAPVINTDTTLQQALLNGFLTGYQTMDLFAAFFFSALIFSQIQEASPQLKTNREVVLFAIKPSLFGALLLIIIYFGLVFLGAHYSPLIMNVNPESMLPTIAKYTMGNNATLFIGITMIFSCLTTAVALNNIYARYICSVLKIRENKFPLILLATTSISFIVSLLDFKGIAAFLAPALEVSYPGLIVLTIMSIMSRKFKKTKVFLFYTVSVVMIAKLFLQG